MDKCSLDDAQPIDGRSARTGAEGLPKSPDFAEADEPRSEPSEVKVHVHLAYGFGPTRWRRLWQEGTLLGINHDNAYGYAQALEMGCALTVSTDHEEQRLSRLIRLGLRALLGFDLVHAWRNRKAIAAADAVWTHTESQSLPVLLILSRQKSAKRPVTIAQTVWLVDDWERIAALRRKLYHALLRRADILSFLSPLAAEKAKRLFSGPEIAFLHYGIKADLVPLRSRAADDRRLRILSLGNDRHRDWATLIAAVENAPDWTLKIVTRANLSKLLANVPQVHVERPGTNAELMRLFDWADGVVVCLGENLHASGITVIQEAVTQGIPVICTNTGGLSAYFGEDEVWYVPPHAPQAVRQAIAMLAQSPALALEKARRAQQRMASGLNSRTYVAAHVALSRRLLTQRKRTAA